MKIIKKKVVDSKELNSSTRSIELERRQSVRSVKRRWKLLLRGEPTETGEGWSIMRKLITNEGEERRVVKLEGDTRGRERASRYRAIETASEIYEINLARPHSAETMQCPVYGRWRG